MFDFVRSHNRILQVALGIVIIPTFGFVGLSSYMQTNEAAVALASVDGRDISRAEFDLQRRKDIDQIRNRNPQIDLKLLDTPEAQRQSLDTLVRERVMLAAVKHEHLQASDERILNEYRTKPEFAELRAMSKEMREAFLVQRGTSGDQVFQTIGQNLSNGQVLQGVAGSGFVPAASLKAMFDAWYDQREIQWQRFDIKDYAAAVKPTDAQVEAYYKSHSAEFFAPEQARIEYLVLDAASLQSQAKVLPEEVRAYYDKNLKAFSTPEERRASHILINVAPNATPADVAKAKALADSVLAEVRKTPAAFADIAKAKSQDGGSAAQGGDLDFMRQGAIPGGFNDALFSMKEGDISNVVRSDAGFHIIKLTAIRGGGTKPFDEVKGQIEDELKLAAGRKLYTADATEFTNTVYDKPDSLDPAAKLFNLTKQTATVTRPPTPGGPALLASPKLLAAVFASDSIKNKHNTEAIEAAPGQLVSVHVVEYTAQHTRPLSEVHDQVAAAMAKDLAVATAKKDGEARVAAARSDATLALPLTATVTRSDRSGAVPYEVAQAALKADMSKGPAVLGLALPDGGYAVIRVVKSTLGTPDANEAAQAKTAFTNAFEDAEARAVYESLKARYKVTYFEDRIAKVTAQAASGAN
jgi:peptidyl-prolyl cis-trans isomerase D